MEQRQGCAHIAIPARRPAGTLPPRPDRGGGPTRASRQDGVQVRRPGSSPARVRSACTCPRWCVWWLRKLHHAERLAHPPPPAAACPFRIAVEPVRRPSAAAQASIAASSRCRSNRSASKSSAIRSLSPTGSGRRLGGTQPAGPIGESDRIAEDFEALPFQPQSPSPRLFGRSLLSAGPAGCRARGATSRPGRPRGGAPACRGSTSRTPPGSVRRSASVSRAAAP